MATVNHNYCISVPTNSNTEAVFCFFIFTRSLDTISAIVADGNVHMEKLCKAVRVVKTCQRWLRSATLLWLASASFNTRRHYKISNNYRSERSEPVWSHAFITVSQFPPICQHLTRFYREMKWQSPGAGFLRIFPLYNTINPIERSGSLIERSWTSAHSAVDTTMDK